MSTLLKIALSSHVIFGIIGVIAVYAVWMSLLKKTPSINFLKYASLTAFISYLISWVTGGYYYVVYYGGVVKPVIKAGEYPWAHAFFTEVKEHVFLFLPFASLSIFLTFWLMGDKLIEDRLLRRSLMFVALAVFLIGAYVTASGVIMSGAAR